MAGLEKGSDGVFPYGLAVHFSIRRRVSLRPHLIPIQSKAREIFPEPVSIIAAGFLCA